MSNSTTETLVKINLTRREAAKALSISEATLDRFTASGKIPCVKLGSRVLYPASLLERWAIDEAKRTAAKIEANKSE